MRKFQAVLVAAAGVAALGSTGTAFAGPSHAVTAVTHVSDHPDTTDVLISCTTDPSAADQVWALDNLSLKFSVTPETAPDNYSVTITAHGSFAAMADPITGACSTGHGSVKGTIQYDVSSTTPPDPTNLPAQEPSLTHQSEMVAQLFDGNGVIVGGGHYTYTYNRIDGGKYTQTG